MAKSTERLDKILSNNGFGTRKEVKALVKDGRVTIDGARIKDPSVHVDPKLQLIEVDGAEVEHREFIYLMMNKPSGVVSATEDNRDETVIDLLEEFHKAYEPFPVGRLDKDTVGLLLLTNDGELAHELLSPKKHVEKTYYVELDGPVGVVEEEAFKLGVTLNDGYKTLPAKLAVEGSGVLVTIVEGKYHQVKRMFQAVGRNVTYLKRLKMGPLILDEDLELGEYRELTADEVSSLKAR